MILQSPLLKAVTPTLHVFSLRDPALPGEGNVSLVQGHMEEVLPNRRQLLESVGLKPGDLVLASQVHGSGILRAHEADRGRGALSNEDRLGSADGLITGVPGLAVGVLVADCCCLLMTDTEGRSVGAFHAGWKGTLAGMAQRAVESFTTEFAIPPRCLRAWIGPAISGRNYQVSEEIWCQFREILGVGDYLMTEPFRVDLKELNRMQLLKAGLPPEDMEVSPICTLESSNCFSHRRGDHPQGRMLGLIARRP
jgi:polyphenol oxidase